MRKESLGLPGGLAIGNPQPSQAETVFFGWGELPCDMLDPSSLTKDQTSAPCGVSMRWTTREVPVCLF